MNDNESFWVDAVLTIKEGIKNDEILKEKINFKETVKNI